MNDSQLQLFRTKQNHELTPDARQVCNFMRNISGPSSKRNIAFCLGWTQEPGDWDRRVKQAVEDSQGIVLGAPGLPYIHHEQISVDEYNRTYRTAVLKQIDSMKSKLVRMDKAVHGRGHQVDVSEIMKGTS